MPRGDRREEMRIADQKEKDRSVIAKGEKQCFREDAMKGA